MRLVLVFLSALLFSCGAKKHNKVTVAVANNMQYAMEDIVVAFEKKHHIKVEISSGSSGTLATQVKQGAPFDLFISANMRYPDILYKDGYAAKKPEIYANGLLVLWSLQDIDLEKGISSLLSNNVKKFAIANPEVAPYGIAAVQALNNSNLFDKLQHKMVYGEGVSQVNQYIKSEAVDAGLTSKSVLFSPKIKEKGKSVEIDLKLYNPISQGIVFLKKGKQNNEKNAELFYKFMFSEDAKAILTKFGYKV